MKILRILSSLFEVWCSFYAQKATYFMAHNMKVVASNPTPATNHRANNLTSPKN